MKQKRNISIEPDADLALGLTAITGFGSQAASQGQEYGDAPEEVAGNQVETGETDLDSSDMADLDNASDTVHIHESVPAQDRPRLEHFSFVCDAGIIAKIRAIARKEHLTIREVMEYPLDWFIHQYEARHGEVRLSGQARKKSVKDIL